MAIPPRVPALLEGRGPMKQPPPFIAMCSRCNRTRKCEVVSKMAISRLWLCRACCDALGRACEAALAHGYQK
jgi:hypothetical protein